MCNSPYRRPESCPLPESEPTTGVSDPLPVVDQTDEGADIDPDDTEGIAEFLNDAAREL